VSRDRRVHSDPDRARQGGHRGCGAPELAGRHGGGQPGRALRRHCPAARARDRRAGQARNLPGPGARRRAADHDLPGSSPVRNRSPWTTTPPSTSRARAASRPSAHAAGAARCSAPTRRPARWTHCSKRPMPAICTSGRCPCDKQPACPAPGRHRTRRSGPPASDRTPAGIRADRHCAPGSGGSRDEA